MFYKETHHITYCTNIHPGKDWPQTWDTLKEFLPRIRERVADGAPFGVGLRLSGEASRELGTGETLRAFRKWLDREGLYVFTMNGFPYGQFHNEVVKDRVHEPDWTSPVRLEYTKRLFDQLAYLLPEGQSGGVSTSPVSYKLWHPTEEARKQVLLKGAEQLSDLILYLHQIEMQQGVRMHLDIEPEPDGMLENSLEVVSFFKEYLEPAAIPRLQAELQLEESAARRLVYRYMTVCYDTCHFALAYETASESLGRLRDAGIAVGKIQVSAALKICFGKEDPAALWESLAAFNEPTYLHQVTERLEGRVKTYADLPEVLEKKGQHQELRAHFHVPIFLEGFGNLSSTQDHILDVLDYLRQYPVTEQLEVETYTWEVLPEHLKKPLADSIVRELSWLKEHL